MFQGPLPEEMPVVNVVLRTFRRIRRSVLLEPARCYLAHSGLDFRCIKDLDILMTLGIK